MKPLRLSWSLLISVLALAVAFFSLHFSHLSSADISVSVGERLTIGYAPDSTDLFVQLDCVASNGGARSGVIRGMAVVLGDSKRQSSLLLKWEGFRKYSTGEGAFVKEAASYPICILGKEAIYRNVSFTGGAGSGGWVPDPGRYDVTLLAWTEPSTSPQLRVPLSVVLSKHDCDRIKELRFSPKMDMIMFNLEGLGEWKPGPLSTGEIESLMGR